MNSNTKKAGLRVALLGAASLLGLYAAEASAQTVVQLTAQRASTTLSDGSTVPMWGYCVAGATPAANVSGAACTAPAAGALAGWTVGPTITIAAGSSLEIDLTNNLKVPTSLVILGQTAGGLLGQGLTRAAGPAHNGTPAVTWPAGDPTQVFTPPAQGTRALSFAQEVAPGATQAYTWNGLKPGTYIYETGSRPSLQAPMGLYGTLIVTAAPVAANSSTGTAFAAGNAYPSYTDGNGITHTSSRAVAYDADAALLFSEIDPLQNAQVDKAAEAHAGAADTSWEMQAWTSDPSNPCNASVVCYPSAVNYSPRFFLINGQSFDPTAPQAFTVPGTAQSGNVLLRLLNAGSRTHIPTVAGAAVALQAEDGNLAPGNPKLQSEVLLTAGKTYDVILNPPNASGAYAPATYSVFDRSLNLTTNNQPLGGMQALILVNGASATVGTPGGVPKTFVARAVDDAYATPVGVPVSANVRTNDFGVTSVAVVTAVDPAAGTLAINPDGSFIFTPAAGYVGVATFAYSGNAGLTNTATVAITVGSATGPNVVDDSYTSAVATAFTSRTPGVLANDSDPKGLALNATLAGTNTCGTVNLRKDGSFDVLPPAGTAACAFQYQVSNSQGAVATTLGNVSVTFGTPSNIVVSVVDTLTRQALDGDYTWVIEQDRSFQHSGDPANGAASNTLATNFHNSYMPLVASGCTGPRSCGDDNTVNGAPVTPRPRVLPGDVSLDFTNGKRYYLSVVPSDASDGAVADPASGTPAVIGHGMGGVSLQAANSKVTVLAPPNPLPVANLSVYVFEDNSPTNGSVDEGEAGLGGFQINIFDVRGSSGDSAGQMTYDLAGMPMTNGLIGKPGCKEYPTPITVGTIYTCPNAPVRVAPRRRDFATPALYQAALAAYQAQLAQDAIDYKLAGMALIPNMIPGRVTVEAIPNAARSIAGEKWVQVSTLEGGKPVDTFVKAGEPAYWQEFGSPGFHSFIGFMNPAHVAARNAALKASGQPTATLTGVISSLHMDRPSAAKLNDSCKSATGPADAACRAALSYTTCYVSLNTGIAGTGENVAYTECDDQGNFTLKNVPVGQHELVIWDQWLDQIIAKKQVSVAGPGTVDVGHVPVFSWFTRVEQSAFIDLNKNGVRDPGEPGVAQIPMNIRFRDGSISNFLTTDGDGVAAADELFPLFNWYVVESDTTRYKGTGVTVVYDAGGKPDSTPVTINTLIPGQTITKDFSGVLNSTEANSLPANQQVAGAVYTTGKTARVDPGSTLTEGLQGFINQTAVIDWGKAPYDTGETGGITGLVYYASTRGFDDPSLEVQFSWEPAVPRVPVNLYAKVKNADGTVSLTLIDSGLTSSWDDSALNVHCPGQGADKFSDVALGGNLTKCYDGQHVFNQVQPVQYDGRYRFPTAQVNKKYLAANGTLIPGTYVVEVVPPAGYDIVKEEDKNILIGEPWNALGQSQFLGVGNIFILPDTATINSSNIAGAGLAFPPCVGPMHTVPDYLTLFSGNQQYAPYAGQERPLCNRKEVALADQTQVNADFQVFTPTPVAAHFVGMMLNDAAAEFDPISPSFGEKAALPNAPISIRDFNGIEILRTYNDKWGTFNGLAPSTLAVNAPNPSGYSPNMLTTCMNDPGPILDQRPGSSTFGQPIIDPAYNPMFSNFCYVWPFMPGTTVYLDTPVLPTAAFASASSYQPVDCQYPNATPAVKRVDGPAKHGPWILANGPRTITVQALGDVSVLNPAYAGPASTTAGTTLPKITRHYGFGSKTGTIALRRTTAAGVTTTTPIPMTNVVWGDLQITADVPAVFAAGDSGELLITNGDNGNASVDTVTVSVEQAAPKVVTASSLYLTDPTAPEALSYAQPVQNAIDAAKPGDLIILEQGSYPELVVMWKPVRLQGVGAASVTINATKFPNRKVADWRGRINALFGVDPIADTVAPTPQVSPLPGQTLTGGIVLLEPTVLATEEGAGITVIASDPSQRGNVCPRSFNGAGPLVTVDSSGATTPDTVPLVSVTNTNPSWSNFDCAPSRIDGVSVTGGDAGGGIYVNGWAHNLQIANNRVFGNAGPFSGGVRVGQPYLEGAVNTGIRGDGSILGFNKNVNIHHNAITTNGMVEGNAAAGATAAGGAGGGLSICSGTDNYKVNYNFICGNFASSDGGGMGHIGLSNGGSIANNQILFNESFSQMSPQNGGGLAVIGESGAGGAGVSPGVGNLTIDSNVIQGNFARAGSGGGLRLQDVNGDDVLCEINNDLCSEGQTRQWQVRVTNNAIVNNVAGASGGGVSLMDTFGAFFNNNTIASNDSTGIVGALFNTNVGGISTGPTTGVPTPAGVATDPTSPQLLATLPVNQRASRQVSTPTIVNDIIWQNRSFFFDAKQIDPLTRVIPLMASNKWTDAVTGGGVKLAQQTATGQCVANAAYWDLGVSDDQAPVAPAATTLTITAASHPTAGTAVQQRTITATTSAAHGLTVGDAITVTGYTGTSAGYNSNATTVLSTPTATTFTYRVTPPPPVANPAVGTGILGGPALAGRGRGLHPTNSVLTPVTAALYPGNGNIAGTTSAALFTKLYCNGSRVLPGVQFEPGTPFQPDFQLDAAATLDESGNFVDLHFGPISLGDPVTGVANGNYHLVNTQAVAYNAGVVTNPANTHDIDGDARPRTTGANGTAGIDIGSDQYRASAVVSGKSATLVAVTTADFGSVNVGQSSTSLVFTYTNTSAAGTGTITVASVVLGGTNPGDFTIANNGCNGAVLNPNAFCQIRVRMTPTAGGARSATLTVTDTAGGAAPASVTVTGTGLQGAIAFSWGLAGTVGNFGTTTGTQTITVTNTGTAPVALGGRPQVTSPAGRFSRPNGQAAGTCSGASVLQPTQSCTVNVTRNSAAGVASTGTLTVNDTGAATATQTLNLLGN